MEQFCATYSSTSLIKNLYSLKTWYSDLYKLDIKNSMNSNNLRCFQDLGAYETGLSDKIINTKHMSNEGI